MSEEKQVEEVVVEDKVEQTHTEKVETVPQTTTVGQETPEENNKAAGFMNPIVFLLFMIFAMVVLLLVTNFRNGRFTGSTSSNRDDLAVAALRADVDAGRMELNRQRMAMGLPPLEGGLEPIGEIADRLKTDTETLVGLAGRFQEMLGEKDAEISQQSAEMIRLEKLRKDMSTEYSRLNKELQRALIGSSEAELLKQSLADSEAVRKALSEELATAQEQLSTMRDAVTSDEYADLERRYQETLRSKDFFENRVKELEAELGKMNLFAESEEELMPAAVELFRRLRKLEGNKDSDLTTEYSRIGVDLGANVLHTLDFRTGSSELSEAEMAQILHIAQDDVPDGDLTLIVGYASKTGDAAANEQLSSDRATSAAEYFAKNKRPGQLVQAVYLGQTDRFNSKLPARNQICEVWRIRKK